MTDAVQSTYLDLINPIPVRTNLANVRWSDASHDCALCSPIIPDRKKGERGLIKTTYAHVDVFPDFPILQASAKSGCALCRLLRKTIRSLWAARPMEEWGVGPLSEMEEMWDQLLAAPWDRKVKIHRLNFTIMTFKGLVDANHCDADVVTGMTLEFGPASTAVADNGEVLAGPIGQIISLKVYDSPNILSPHKGARRYLPAASTLDARNIAMMENWIDDCKLNHSECRHVPTLWMPTRLLDVGSADGSRNPRLVVTKVGNYQDTKYAALSHMWGDTSVNPPLRTFLANYDDMIDGIPLWRLNRNFYDTVVVCRALGIRYVWIDSLCIIQDSHDDWLHEAALMHMAYRYAEVTLVATSVTSSHTGYLQRDLTAVPAAKVGYTLDGEDRYMIVSPRDDFQTGIRPGDVDDSTWNQRGWTMQERALSTRLVHFCRNKLYFECRSSLQSEENEPETGESRPFAMWPRQTVLDGKRKTLFFYEQWKKCLIQYCRRQLTRGSDKLMAIRSVAEEMSTVIEDSYIAFAGVWSGDIRSEILWYAESGRKSKPSFYRAPSWSWASIDTRISFVKGDIQGKLPMTLSDRTFRIESVQARHPTLPAVNYLEVAGYCRMLSGLDRVDDRNHWTAATRGGFPWDLLVEGEGGNSAKFAHGLLDMDDTDNVVSSGRTFYYLHVENEHHPSGLVLAQDNATELFERIGVATIFWSAGEPILDPPFQRDDYRSVIII